MATMNYHKKKVLLKNKKTKQPKSDAHAVLNSAKYTNHNKLLEQCREYYERLATQRSKMERATNYAFGRQWDDLIVDPDSKFTKAYIKEEEYIKRQGKVPLKYNVIAKSRKSLVGLFVNNKQEPHAIAHDRDEQKLGEMMTVAMQYAYNINDISQLNARLLEKCFCTGLFVRSIYYRHIPERQMADVFVQNENPYMIFFNDDVQDDLLRDLTCIGAIRDMSLQNLITTFSTSKAEAVALTEEYKGVDYNSQKNTTYDTFTSEAKRDDNFLTPKVPNQCRVFEVWTKETEECFYCHDTAIGTECYRAIEEEAQILQENAQRAMEMQSLGYSPEQASIIEYEWHIREYWMVRFLTPNGNCIFECESPYYHGSHPFIIGAYPMIDGEIHSLAEEMIDPQRAINRTLSQIDFMRQNGAKNVLMCPVDAKPDHMSYADFASEYTRNGAVLYYKAKPNVPIPHQLKSNSVAAGDLEVVNLYMQLNDQISGISGAIRGETPNSSTPASLYAQEAQNSTNNIADFLSWFNTCIKNSDTKMMKLIQQYYDDTKYIPIAGKNFSEEAKWYTPEKIRQSDFDITLTEGVDTVAYRMALENTLFEALKGGMIDLKMYLEASSAPYADRLLEMIKSREEEGMQQGIDPAMIQQAMTEQQQQPTV